MISTQFGMDAEEETEMLYSENEIENANDIEIIYVLRNAGEPFRRIGSYYETEAHDSLRIKGNRYNWYSRGTYGKTINFVMEYFGLGFPAAVGYLLNKQPLLNNMRLEMPSITQASIHEHRGQWKIANLKESSEKKRAIAYLCKDRGIQYELVRWLIRENLLGQDTEGCVLFKAHDESGIVVGAERRSMNPESKFKQTVLGSKSEYGVALSFGRPKKAYFFESAIDTISFYEMYAGKLNDTILTSMRGLKSGLIDATLKRYNIDCQNAYLCVDNDKSGRDFADRSMKRMPGLRTIKVGGDCKDWNEMLQKTKGENR